MAAALVSPGARRCLLGIRNGNPIKMIKAELSQLVQERKKETNNVFAPELLQNYTSSESPQVGNLSNEEVKSLILTLQVRGSDEAVLDSYTQFMRRAATVLSLNVSGNIIVPRPIEKHNLLKPTSSPYYYKPPPQPYKAQSHDRMLQVRELTGETADIYVEYIRRHLPEGVSMSVDQADMRPVLEYIRNVFHH